jgi:hypothetical protein
MDSSKEKEKELSGLFGFYNSFGLHLTASSLEKVAKRVYKLLGQDDKDIEIVKVTK